MTEPVGEAQRRSALAALCVTQIVGWGVLYYALPVALTSVTADTGWAASTVTAAFTVALLISGVAGIPAGRLIDRLGPRAVMTAGSAMAGAGMAGVAWAPSLALFWTAWVLAGVAMAGVLYQAAFSAIAIIYRQGRTKALTVLTLAGGLASTVFAPFAHLLLTQMSWRATYLVLAAILVAITVPAHWWFLPQVSAFRSSKPVAVHSVPVREILRSAVFVRSSAGFALAAFGLYAASLTLIPILQARGMSAGLAAVTFGLLGAGQLLGRIAFAPLARSTSLATRTWAIVGVGSVLIAALAWLPGPVPLLVALSVLLGAARGAVTLLQATLPADLWGPERYATLTGYFAAPISIAMAISPWAGTAISTHFGYAAGWTLLAVLTAAGAVLVTHRLDIARGYPATDRTVRPAIAEPS